MFSSISKYGPRRNSVDQFEKAKTATMENTSISEEAKVSVADKAIAIVSIGQKDGVKKK